MSGLRLVPEAWTPEAWHGWLVYMARVCIHAHRASELGDWAATVQKVYQLGMEVE